eukprot:CAMPEP_0202915152 /NCGR_PEP_ID=MMETSP1392-20130828/64945_1 /ASSEMBLY_ACC=CAM_ASM_000868 /TAXON_ID=225041 /ORGANISM="Chlamydomonas chlamydogama, Strain SAG 11-48b" /LENGTH=951 /DNA_ID=CAMNT_0049607061 /DNA_START=144 /DNA_END=2998 /DNA_ORIENTATION=-
MSACSHSCWGLQQPGVAPEKTLIPAQIDLLQKQIKALASAVELQDQLTVSAQPERPGWNETVDVHQLSADAPPGESDTPHGSLPLEVADEVPVPDSHGSPGSPDSSRAADQPTQAAASPIVEDVKSLITNADELFVTVFSVVDTLGRDEVFAFSYMSGMGEETIRNGLQRLRGTMRNFLQRMQKKRSALGGSPNSVFRDQTQHYSNLAGTSGSDASVGHQVQAAGLLRLHDADTQEQLSRVRDLLGPDGGLQAGALSAMPLSRQAVAAGDASGLLLIYMHAASSYEVRTAQLQAMAATKPTVLHRMISPRLLDLLDAWLKEADADSQVTFIRVLMSTLQHLPIPLPMLIGSQLQKSVAKLLKSRSERIVSAASSVLLHWKALADAQSTTSVVQRLGPSGYHHTGVPLTGSQEAAAAAQAAQAAKQPFKQPKAAHFSTRPMSADDIRKAKERERWKAALHGQKLEPPAKRMAMSSGGGGVSASERQPVAVQAAPDHAAAAAVVVRPSGSNAHEQKASRAMDVDDLSPEVLEKLRRTREMRKRATDQASQVAKTDAYLKEVAAAIISYESKIQQLRARREERAKLEAKRMDSVNQLKFSMAAKVMYTTPPPLVPLTEELAAGQDSVEAKLQAERARKLPPVKYASMAELPNTPAEPAGQDAAPTQAGAPPTVPWVPGDPVEQEQQNNRTWSSGVRLPGFVLEPALLSEQIAAAEAAAARRPSSHSTAQRTASQPSSSSAPAAHEPYQPVSQTQLMAAPMVQQQQRHYVQPAAAAAPLPSWAVAPPTVKAAEVPSYVPPDILSLVRQPDKLGQVLKEQPHLAQAVRSVLAGLNTPHAQNALHTLDMLTSAAQQQQPVPQPHVAYAPAPPAVMQPAQILAQAHIVQAQPTVLMPHMYQYVVPPGGKPLGVQHVVVQQPHVQQVVYAPASHQPVVLQHQQMSGYVHPPPQQQPQWH